MFPTPISSDPWHWLDLACVKFGAKSLGITENVESSKGLNVNSRSYQGSPWLRSRLIEVKVGFDFLPSAQRHCILDLVHVNASLPAHLFFLESNRHTYEK